MAISRIELSLRIGDGKPDLAPPELMNALRSVEVTQADTAPCGFQLTFHTEMRGPGAENLALAQNELLRPWQRVLVRVAADGEPSTLIDGFITHRQLVAGNGPEPSHLVVTGEDVSVKMDLIDFSTEFPAMPDDLIVEMVMAPFLLMGITPHVVPTLTALNPFDHVPQQSGTDRKTLLDMAEKHGHVFYVTPDDELFSNTAYWGPPPRSGDPAAVLDVAVGPSSTVTSFQAEENALAPETYFGWGVAKFLDPEIPLPVVTLEGERSPAYAARPALTASGILDLTSRHKLWCDTQLDPISANIKAQAQTDASTDAVVTVTCTVPTLSVGTILRAPGTVGVRGAGTDHDGLYYLKQATHHIDLMSDEQWDYTQALTLTREGAGTTTSTLVAS